jgi:stearoyl-CoA desaturase (delta-9 desaturase)
MNTAVVHVMPAAPFRAAQRRHFLFSVVLPTLLTLTAPLALPLFHHGWLAAWLLLVMWFLVGGVGVSVGLHRHFSHRAFEATPALRLALGALGAMAAQGPVGYWVALHRMHHASSDQAGDPHSPQPGAWVSSSRWRAAWQGHIGWVLGHDVPKPTRYARELLADPLVRRLGRAYALCVALGLALPALASVWVLHESGQGAAGAAQNAAFGLYWGGIVRVALGHHVIWAINSWCHLAGARPHATSDHSANVAALALVSWGESWHNNHHAQPTSARFGHGWRQPDVGWWVVRLFVALGWARLRLAPATSASNNAV